MDKLKALVQEAKEVVAEVMPAIIAFLVLVSIISLVGTLIAKLFWLAFEIPGQVTFFKVFVSVLMVLFIKFLLKVEWSE